MITLKNITKTYFTKEGVSFRAINNISLQFAQSGFVFILGKSGSGKTTILNLLGALDKVDQGVITFGDKVLSEMKNSQLDSYRNSYVGFIFQHYNLIPNFTVYENVRIALDFKRINDLSIIDEYAKKLEISDLLYKKVYELSGGERQRVTILRSLVKSPQIILADEPSGALDSVTASILYDMLSKLSKTKLVVVVSHDREVAAKYADRIIEIKDGEIFKDLSTKPKIDSEKKSEFIANSLIKIPAGKEISNDELDFINDYLSKNASETFISIETNENKVKSLNPHLAETIKKENEEETYEQYRYQADNFIANQFIKTKMKLKTVAKLSLKNLQLKRFKLVLTIILTFISTILFMFSHDLRNFEIRRATTDTIERYQHHYVPFRIENINALNGIYDEFPDFTYVRSFLMPQSFDNPYNYFGNLFTDRMIFGFIEYQDISNFGLTIKYGKAVINNDNEIIISEFTAFDLTKVWRVEMSELIGMSLSYLGADLTIAGIYQADIERFMGKITDFHFFNNDFFQRRESLYGRIFVNDTFFETQIRAATNFVSYNPQSNLRSILNNINVNTGSITELSGALINIIDPNPTLKGLYISTGLYFELFRRDVNLLQPHEILEDINIFNANNLLEIQTGRVFSFYHIDQGFTIRGIFQDSSIRAYFTQEYIEEVNLNINRGFDILYIERAFFQQDTRRKVDLLLDNQIVFGHPAQELLLTFDLIRGGLSTFLRWMSYIITGFVVILLYSFISSSIIASKKQIGLLRALGAKNSDIFKIFLVETIIFMGLSLAFINVLYNIARIILNNQLSRPFDITVIFVYFNIQTIISTIGLTLITISIALLVPMIKIFRMTPIDAINEKIK
ncbi:MAG: ABC transporter ATP-binding protein/permease [Erysipelotrichales bacterium]|nr:ABC transporter ATP-binding protein/permease [Erysipelotrichales bacterium]